jgi:hypothetical protein
MKQILKYGKYNVIKCPTCECEYSFDQTDIKDGKVECPCCKEQNTAPVQHEKK